MSNLPRSVLLGVLTLFVGGCGNASSSHPINEAPGVSPGGSVVGTDTAPRGTLPSGVPVTPGQAFSGNGTHGSIRGSSGGIAAAGSSSTVSHNGETGAAPTQTAAAAGNCPDPRYCPYYALVGPHWVPDSSGRIVLHYRVNATNPPPAQTSLSAQQIQTAIDAAAQTWMGADPQILLVDDGPTTDRPLLNGVIGFAPGNNVEQAQADTATTCNSCDTYRAFDISFEIAGPWLWEPCDPSHGQPCSQYPVGNPAGPDLQAIATHEWGHVLGLAHSPGDHTVVGNLTMDADVAPLECQTSQAGCRAADTLGLGDVLGVRHLYPTSAPMPTLYEP